MLVLFVVLYKIVIETGIVTHISTYILFTHTCLTIRVFLKLEYLSR